VIETEEAGRKFAANLTVGDVLAFYGGLGMGKTAFIRGIAAGLDVTDHVSSPTFALVHEYRGKIPLFHFDMYRVTSWDDLDSTGFFDYLDASGICAIEWSENIEQALPENTVRVEITRGDDDETRLITIKGKCSDEDTRG
jgi:tRNA threonylcarbamoyladenosine biosynthesis protein TsaE